MQDVSTESLLSEREFRSLAGRALLPSAPSMTNEVTTERAAEGAPKMSPSDFDLNPELDTASKAAAPLCPAAVLVPVVARENLTVLFTKRTDAMPRHPGQIAFPGGKTEPQDDGPLATALREAHEEIGLDPNFVDPLGYLDSYRTGTGYRIVPVVAIVREGFKLKLDPREVADAFEIPLAFLMDSRNHTTHTRTLAGAERRFYAMPFEERYIWGATAGILKNMHERLFSACSAS
jgi:8-oxo-dGTP pyrophosphatase MutT (NUDIX family)